MANSERRAAKRRRREHRVRMRRGQGRLATYSNSYIWTKRDAPSMTEARSTTCCARRGDHRLASSGARRSRRHAGPIRGAEDVARRRAQQRRDARPSADAADDELVWQSRAQTRGPASRPRTPRRIRRAEATELGALLAACRDRLSGHIGGSRGAPGRRRASRPGSPPRECGFDLGRGIAQTAAIGSLTRSDRTGKDSR